MAYAVQREWLDFANAATWLAVVAMLELGIRVPATRRHFHRMRGVLSSGLYAALAALLVTWLVIGLDGGGAGAWLDAWDAALWLLAFAVIELNVFGWARRDAMRGSGLPGRHPRPASFVVTRQAGRGARCKRRDGAPATRSAGGSSHLRPRRSQRPAPSEF